MEDNKKIKSFNEHQEKLDISDVIISNKIILEIRKNGTIIDFCKETDGLITIDMQDDENINFVTISLTKEEVKKVIKQLQDYIE